MTNFKSIPPNRVQYLVVHCSASRPSMDIGVAEIEKWHRQRGFLKVGYHFVIRRDGSIETGREVKTDGTAEPGAHFAGLNLVSIGICLVGGIAEKLGPDREAVPEANFTPAQYTALAALLESLKSLYPKSVSVIGHGDALRPGETPRALAVKACPSFDVRDWIKNGCPTSAATRA